MKFNRSSQLVLVSAVSLLAAGLVTACGTLTVDFVYRDQRQGRGSQQLRRSRRLRGELGVRLHAPDSHFALSFGRTQSRCRSRFDRLHNSLRVNQDDNTIVQFIIGNDGKLYPQNTLNTPGVFPLAVAVDGQLPLRRGHLSAAADLLDRGALLGLCGRVPILTAAGTGPALSSGILGRRWPMRASARTTGR